jgi:hypothetical protein
MDQIVVDRISEPAPEPRAVEVPFYPVRPSEPRSPSRPAYVFAGNLNLASSHAPESLVPESLPRSEPHDAMAWENGRAALKEQLDGWNREPFTSMCNVVSVYGR